MEMDPASLDQRRLSRRCWPAGVNRVSLGGQSSMRRRAGDAGPRHRRADLLEAAGGLPRRSGRGRWGSWSLDLDPGLAPTDLKTTGTTSCGQAVAVLDAPHLSILRPDRRTAPVRWRQKSVDGCHCPFDLGADLMHHPSERLKAAGYGTYEISIRQALPCFTPQPGVLERGRLVGFRGWEPPRGPLTTAIGQATKTRAALWGMAERRQPTSNQPGRAGPTPGLTA